MFSAVFIFLLLVGSSIAQITDLQKLTSLNLVNARVSSYVVNLYQIYNPTQFEPAFSMLTIIDRGKNISQTINQIVQNQANDGSQPINAVDSADEIITQWTTEANDAINDIVHRLNNGIEQVNINIRNKTEEVINAINQNANILPEHKGNWCPIFPTLSDIMEQFGNAQLREEFKANYRLYDTPRQQ